MMDEVQKHIKEFFDTAHALLDKAEEDPENVIVITIVGFSDGGDMQRVAFKHNLATDGDAISYLADLCVHAMGQEPEQTPIDDIPRRKQ